jgi:hypothetical protein
MQADSDPSLRAQAVVNAKGKLGELVKVVKWWLEESRE